MHCLWYMKKKLLPKSRGMRNKSAQVNWVVHFCTAKICPIPFSPVDRLKIKKEKIVTPRSYPTAQVSRTIQGRGPVDRRFQKSVPNLRRRDGRSERGPGPVDNVQRTRGTVQSQPVQPGKRSIERDYSAGQGVQAGHPTGQD